MNNLFILLSNYLEIKPLLGLSDLLFGSSMTDAEKVFGKADESEFLEDIEEFQSTVWHYWDRGFSLFFDENEWSFITLISVDTQIAKTRPRRPGYLLG